MENAARYSIFNDAWVDMPEAQPRARARLKDPEGQPVYVVIDLQGLVHAPDSVEIDRYEDEPEIRDEVRPVNEE